MTAVRLVNGEYVISLRRRWWETQRPRRKRFRLAPAMWDMPGYYGIVWLHPDERPKPHPPVKANRRRTHRRRT